MTKLWARFVLWWFGLCRHGAKAGWCETCELDYENWKAGKVGPALRRLGL